MKKITLSREENNSRIGFKYYHILCCCYLGIIITSLTVSARLLPFHIPFTNFDILLTGGTWTVPLAFTIQDIITEVYGAGKSKHTIQIAVFILIAYILYTSAITSFPVPNGYHIGNSYNDVFNALPRHLIALIATLITANFINNYLLSKSKILFHGKYIALRFLCATLIGELILQLLGTTVAWFGNLKFGSEILPFVLFSYSYKVIFSTASIPIVCAIANYLKKSEGVDVYDWKVNYNPFSFKET